MVTQKQSGDRGFAGHVLIGRLQSLSDSIRGCLACLGWKIEHQRVMVIPNELIDFDALCKISLSRLMFIIKYFTLRKFKIKPGPLILNLLGLKESMHKKEIFVCYFNQSLLLIVLLIGEVWELLFSITCHCASF